MSESEPSTRARIFWAREPQAERLLAALDRAGAAPDAAGGPGLNERAAGAEPIEDLSQTLRAAADADVLLAARAPAETLEWLESRGSAADLKRRHVRIVSFEPLPTSAMSHLLHEQADAQALPLLAPHLRDAPLGASLRDALNSFGPVQTALFAARGDASFGSLGAKLLDALDILTDVLGEPELVDCSVASPRAASGVRAAPPDDLSLLTGSLTAHLRFESESSAVLSLSDQAGRWFRGLSLAGESGLIRFDDHGFEWIGPGGETVEKTDRDATGDVLDELAAQAVEAFDRPAPSLPARTRALVAAGAAILSARTGQPESPDTVRRMASLDR